VKIVEDKFTLLSDILGAFCTAIMEKKGHTKKNNIWVMGEVLS